MEQGFFKKLPVELTIDILSSLPLQNIIVCKCVSKTWHDLLESEEFDASRRRRSKSVTDLVILHHRDLEFFESDGHTWTPIMKYNFPGVEFLQVVNSVNGLIFLKSYFVSHPVCIWNPITRECINLFTPDESGARYYGFGVSGFGVSKTCGFYKVVIIVFERYHLCTCCYVYTLGTGSWRRIGLPDVHRPYLYGYGDGKDGVFFNGKLHWLVGDFNRNSPWISCFDLETELFTTFSCPPLPPSTRRSYSLIILDNSLCLYGGDSYLFVIWMMKEYGVEESWMRQYTIVYREIFKNSEFFTLERILKPLQVTEEGDILMLWNKCAVLHYSTKHRKLKRINVLEYSSGIYPVIHNPTFTSLKNTFESEDVTYKLTKVSLLRSILFRIWQTLVRIEPK